MWQSIISDQFTTGDEIRFKHYWEVEVPFDDSSPSIASGSSASSSRSCFVVPSVDKTEGSHPSHALKYFLSGDLTCDDVLNCALHLNLVHKTRVQHSKDNYSNLILAHFEKFPAVTRCGVMLFSLLLKRDLSFQTSTIDVPTLPMLKTFFCKTTQINEGTILFNFEILQP